MLPIRMTYARMELDMDSAKTKSPIRVSTFKNSIAVADEVEDEGEVELAVAVLLWLVPSRILILLQLPLLKLLRLLP